MIWNLDYEWLQNAELQVLEIRPQAWTALLYEALLYS
jgi:hypothetical protein